MVLSNYNLGCPNFFDKMVNTIFNPISTRLINYIMVIKSILNRVNCDFLKSIISTSKWLEKVSGFMLALTFWQTVAICKLKAR